MSGKRGGNEQHAAWITVGVWTSIFLSLCPVLAFGVSVCVGRSLLAGTGDCIWDNSSSVNALPEVFAVQGVLSSLFLTFHCVLFVCEPKNMIFFILFLFVFGVNEQL